MLVEVVSPLGVSDDDADDCDDYGYYHCLTVTISHPHVLPSIVDDSESKIIAASGRNVPSPEHHCLPYGSGGIVDPARVVIYRPDHYHRPGNDSG